jgi:hypothetical protein
MDDLEIKEYYRDRGFRTKASGKSLMSKQPTCYSYYNNTINQKLSKDIPGFLTEFDKISEINLLRDVTMNSEFLFNEAEELLKELAVDVNKVGGGYSDYGNKQFSYALPVTDYMDDTPVKTLRNFKDNYFLYKSKYYDSNMVYRTNPSSSSKLDLVCSAEIDEPDFSEISPFIQKLETSASDGKYYYNLNHGINVKSSGWGYEYSKSDSIVGSSTNGSNLGGQIYKKKADPIYVKINTKGSVKVTHLGFLSGRIPIVTWWKKRTELQKKKYSNLVRKPCYILDTSNPIPFVKKAEIFFRSKITKKWIFLKYVSFSQYGLASCFHEDIVPINSNMFDIDGLETVELKIVPTEYVERPSIRVAIYGIVKKEYRNKNKSGDGCEVVNYTISSPCNNSNQVLKHGNHWNWDYWRFGHDTKFEKKRKLIEQIKEQLNDYEEKN